MPDKNLFLVNGWPSDGIRALPGFKPGDAVVLAVQDTADRWKAAGVSVRSIDSYGDREEIVGAEARVWEAARRWHQDPQIAPVLAYGSHQPAELCELYFGNYLKWIYTRIRQVAACLDEERPARIWVAEKSSAVTGFFPQAGEPCFEKALRVLGRAADFLNAGIETSREPVRGSALAEWAKGWARPLLRGILSPGGGDAAFKSANDRAVIVLAGAPHHMEPVAKALAGRSRLIHLDESFRAAKLDLVKKYDMRYVSYPEIEKVFWREAAPALALYANRLREQGEAVKRRVASAGLLKIDGLDLVSAADDRLDWFLRDAAHEAARWSEVLGRWLEREEVSAVVVDEDTVTFRKTLVREAARHGIATIQVPHGVALAGFHYDLFPVASSRVAVGGDGIAAFYASSGVASEKIRITGVPRYDTLARADREDKRGQVRARLGLGEKDKMVLFGATTLFALNTERTAEERRQATEDLAAAASKFSQIRMAVRLHPLDLYPEATWVPLKRAGIRLIEKSASGNVADWIAAADAVVSFPSNLVYEALVLGKPVVILDYFKTYPDHVPYFSAEGGRFKAKNQKAIEALFREFWDPQPQAAAALRVESARQWLMDHWVGALDGRSGERVADVVLDAVRQNSERRKVSAV